jgi:hypothetical protein
MVIVRPLYWSQPELFTSEIMSLAAIVTGVVSAGVESGVGLMEARELPLFAGFEALALPEAPPQAVSSAIAAIDTAKRGT